MLTRTLPLHENINRGLKLRRIGERKRPFIVLPAEGADKSKVIAGATITMGDRTATSDAKGYFEIKDVALGSITLKISKAGYKDGSVTRSTQLPDTWASVGLSQ